MQLQKLELYGFKSFADKTEFIFDNGMTVFCGPNGCGKSNIVDAVKWVLGEQSAKSLRGSEMADVIFNGTANRKSLGFAEVSLTILNDKGMLPVDYEEVRITRRLYRSGDSEYLINMQPVRLCDIRELFMDTGIGMDAYSVMEQGKIDAVLQSNPSDRRAVFEEAAGISKYKAKKHAAMLKLERVEQNLLRLGDIIEEVEKQLRSIKRQASAARRYKESSDLLNERKVQLALHRYHELGQDVKAVEDEIWQGRDKLQSLRSSSEKKEAERTELETSAIEMDKKIARVDSADAEIQSQMAAAEEAVNLNRERMQELQLAESKYTSEINMLTSRLNDARRELERSQHEIGAIEDGLATETASLEAQLAAIKEMTEQCMAIARDIEKQRIEVMDLMRLTASQQNRLSTLDAERNSIENQRTRITQRIEDRRGELAHIEERLTADVGEIDSLSEQLDGYQVVMVEKQARRNDVKTRVELLGDKIAEKRSHLAARESRRQVLQDLEEKHEGLNQGVVNILQEMKTNGGGAAGVKGMVADLMQADMEHAPALEAALGESAQYLVTESIAHSIRAVENLKQNQKGRATFLSLDRMEHNGHDPLPETNGCFIGRAHELIQCDDAHKPLFASLLHNTLIVTDLKGAVEMSSNGFRRFRLVTLEGDIIDSDGAVTGGSNQGRMGVISRKSELHAITAELQGLEAEIERLQEEYTQRAHERDELEIAVDELRNKIHAATVDLAEKRKELSRLTDTKERFAEEMESARTEFEELGRSLGQVSRQKMVVQIQLDELRSKEQAVRSQIETMDADRKEKDDQRAGLEARATELKVHIARQRERSESLKFAIERYRRSIEENEAAIERDRQEIELCGRRRQDSAAVIEQRQAEIDRLIVEREALKQNSVELRNRRAELAERLTAVQEELKALRGEAEQREDGIHKLELKLNETRLRLDNLEETTRERHRVSLKDTIAEFIAALEAEEQPTDWNALRAEIENLEEKIQRMGNVNLNAIDEQEQLETRDSFLTSQRDDLASAKNSLQDVIRKINRTSRDMFQQTFIAVRENFGITFRKLFGGGKADIILEEDKDILDAGIEIVAKPPGKELRSISLMSGGEKSLTAVALLFAIFQSKPSPFCILDEVDAALDESNTDRFIAIIREFTESQFIIISHSRRTIASADTLYGITMQESGVSKRIAVKLEETSEELEPDEAVA